MAKKPDKKVKKQEILDEHLLYSHIHFNGITYRTKNKKPLPRPSELTNTPKEGPNRSCDWEKLSTPGETLKRVGKQYKHGKQGVFKNADEFFVFSWVTGFIRSLIPSQKVEHDPIFNNPEKEGYPNNPAHSIIIGDKSEEELRLKLSDEAKWEISPPSTKAKMKEWRKQL